MVKRLSPIDRSSQLLRRLRILSLRRRGTVDNIEVDATGGKAAAKEEEEEEEEDGSMASNNNNSTVVRPRGDDFVVGGVIIMVPPVVILSFAAALGSHLLGTAQFSSIFQVGKAKTNRIRNSLP